MSNWGENQYFKYYCCQYLKFIILGNRNQKVYLDVIVYLLINLVQLAIENLHFSKDLIFLFYYHSYLIFLNVEILLIVFPQC